MGLLDTYCLARQLKWTLTAPCRKAEMNWALLARTKWQSNMQRGRVGFWQPGTQGLRPNQNVISAGLESRRILANTLLTQLALYDWFRFYLVLVYIFCHDLKECSTWCYCDSLPAFYINYITSISCVILQDWILKFQNVLQTQCQSGFADFTTKCDPQWQPHPISS